MAMGGSHCCFCGAIRMPMRFIQGGNILRFHSRNARSSTSAQSAFLDGKMHPPEQASSHQVAVSPHDLVVAQ
jgi:hypothetical protein